MTTATPTKPKTTSVSARLQKMEQERDEARAAAREARALRDTYDADTRNLQHDLSIRGRTIPEEFDRDGNIPLDGTQADELRQNIRKRMAGRNPHLDEYEARQTEYVSLSDKVETFKTERVHERIREALANREDNAKAREAIGALLAWVDGERAVVEQVTQVVTRDTPVLQRQAQATVTFDPRLDEWHNFLNGMAAALEEGIVEPGLTPYAEHRVATLG